MYEEFTNLFSDAERKIEEGNIIIEGDVYINVLENDPPVEEKKKTIKKSLKELRKSGKMNKWSQKIRSRDEGTCQCCKDMVATGLQAHHILPLAKFPDLAFEEGNGIALCKKCHEKYHNMYRGEENAANFAKFLNDFGNRRY